MQIKSIATRPMPKTPKINMVEHEDHVMTKATTPGPQMNTMFKNQLATTLASTATGRRDTNEKNLKDVD